MKTRVLIVGGFLGAGKTTALWAAAKALSEQGHKVGIITNDQASELVDTRFLETSGGKTSEVSGSCFCCNFPGYIEAIKSMQDQGIDTVLSEPVGSCTDLSATIVQPLKDQYSEVVSLGPLSVLVDAARLKDILAGDNSGLHPSAAYIVRKQMEEADFLVINKIDMYSREEIEDLKTRAAEMFPLATVCAVSALDGTGISEWLEAVERSEKCGTHLLTDIDYDVYAEGEAVLGWLNATVLLHDSSCDWGEFLKTFLDSLSRRFDANGNSVGHVKVLITENRNLIVGNVVGDNSTLKVRGSSKGGVRDVEMTINARVQMSPEQLEEAVKEELSKCASSIDSYEISVLKCLQPGRPNPTHRYSEVI